jgi:hypothetical protein
MSATCPSRPVRFPLVPVLAAAVALSLGILAIGLAAVMLSARANADTRPYDDLARAIVAGIDAQPAGAVTAVGGYGAPGVAVQTVDETGDPSAGEDHTRRLMAALTRLGGGRFRLIALDTLDELIVAIKSQNLPDDEERDRIAHLRANARADIFVTGRLRADGLRTTLSYQAVATTTGDLLAVTEDVIVSGPRTLAVAERPVFEPLPRQTDADEPYRPTVEEAEALLFDKGYDPGPVDGVLTEQTRAALRAYQLDSALPVNGRLTRRVVANLRRDARTQPF